MAKRPIRVSRLHSGRVRLTVHDEFDQVEVDLSPLDARRVARELKQATRTGVERNGWTDNNQTP